MKSKLQMGPLIKNDKVFEGSILKNVFLFLCTKLIYK